MLTWFPLARQFQNVWRIITGIANKWENCRQKLSNFPIIIYNTKIKGYNPLQQNMRLKNAIYPHCRKLFRHDFKNKAIYLLTDVMITNHDVVLFSLDIFMIYLYYI